MCHIQLPVVNGSCLWWDYDEIHVEVCSGAHLPYSGIVIKKCGYLPRVILVVMRTEELVSILQPQKKESRKNVQVWPCARPGGST